MKSVIICASTHHGNTRKVVDAIASACGVDVIDATTTSEKDLSEYDLIGFASGIYAGQFHKKVSDFAEKNLPMNKKVFFIMTSAMNKDFSKSMNSALNGKNAMIVGKFTCKGFNTFGPFKLVGGTNKGHPDEKDLADAVKFFKRIAG